MMVYRVDFATTDSQSVPNSDKRYMPPKTLLCTVNIVLGTIQSPRHHKNRAWDHKHALFAPSNARRKIGKFSIITQKLNGPHYS